MHSLALLFPTLLPLSPCTYKKLAIISHSLMESSNIHDTKIIIKSRITTVKILFNTVATMQTNPHTFLTSTTITTWIKFKTKPRMALISYKSKLIHHKAFYFKLITTKTHLRAADISCSYVFGPYCMCAKSLLRFELWLTDFISTLRHH